VEDSFRARCHGSVCECTPISFRFPAAHNSRRSWNSHCRSSRTHDAAGIAALKEAACNRCCCRFGYALGSSRYPAAREMIDAVWRRAGD
jgi:hypothetical protein